MHPLERRERNIEPEAKEKRLRELRAARGKADAMTAPEPANTERAARIEQLRAMKKGSR